MEPIRIGRDRKGRLPQHSRLPEALCRLYRRLCGQSLCHFSDGHPGQGRSATRSGVPASSRTCLGRRDGDSTTWRFLPRNGENLRAVAEATKGMVAWVPKDDSTSAAIASLIDAAGLAGNQEGNGRPEPSIIARCNAAGAGEVFLVSVERLRGGWRRNVADRREAYRDCKGKGACPRRRLDTRLPFWNQGDFRQRPESEVAGAPSLRSIVPRRRPLPRPRSPKRAGSALPPQSPHRQEVRWRPLPFQNQGRGAPWREEPQRAGW